MKTISDRIIDNILGFELSPTRTENGETFAVDDKTKALQFSVYHRKDGIASWIADFSNETEANEYTELKFKMFPNGFDNWRETHFEVVQFLADQKNAEDFEDSNSVIKTIYKRAGSSGLYLLAEEWADEFEQLNRGRKWDGEFMDEIELFCQNKNKVV